MDNGRLAGKLTTMGWGLFFIWLGLVLLVDGGTGMILVGIGVITAGIQLARRRFGMESDRFWVVVGLIFLAVGVWEIYDVQIPIFSIVLMIIGAAMFASSFGKKP